MCIQHSFHVGLYNKCTVASDLPASVVCTVLCLDTATYLEAVLHRSYTAHRWNCSLSHVAFPDSRAEWTSWPFVSNPSREPTLRWEGSDISTEKLQCRWYKNLAHSPPVAWFLWQPAFVWRSADLDSGSGWFGGFKGTGLRSEIQGNITCLTRTRRVCEDVSLRTCQALDHSFPSLAPSFCFRTLFFFFLLHKHGGLFSRKA